MGGNKRKREEDDSDDDPSYGMRQILPVACLPANFDGEPTDGLQYLFTVRRDAKLLPAITRVPNPYETAPSIPFNSNTKLASDDVKGASRGFLSDEWRLTFVRRFDAFRENLNQATPRVSAPTQTKTMPEKKDREAWWDFISGAPESAWNKPPSKRSTKPKRKSGGGLSGEVDLSDPDVIAAGWQAVPLNKQTSEHPLAVENPPPSTVSFDIAPADPNSAPSPPREPTPTLILSMDHRMAIHLIMYFTHWINQHLEALDHPAPAETQVYTPLESHARWIFALLARVDSYCSADDMNGLRSLVRACLAFIRSRNAPANESVPDNEGGGSDSDIASTPGIETVQLPPVVNPTDPAHQAPPTEETTPPVGESSPQSMPTMSATSVGLILCAVAGYWNQKDLWSDAEKAFS